MARKRDLLNIELRFRVLISPKKEQRELEDDMKDICTNACNQRHYATFCGDCPIYQYFGWVPKVENKLNQ